MHDGPEPFGEPAGDGAEGFEVLSAAFGHLLVVDPDHRAAGASAAPGVS